MEKSEQYRAYAQAGFVLVPIASGRKGPTAPFWQRYENCVTDPDEAAQWPGNMGIAHAWSRTCAIDLDDLPVAKAWLEERGIDVDALLAAPDAVMISSGRPGRAKLLYRIPDGQEPLWTKQPKGSGVELRCASGGGLTVQDVLPPSIHPDTQRPYEWVLGPVADWACPPVLPAEILALWRSLLRPNDPGGERIAPIGVEADRIRGALSCIDPDLSYHEWIKVGMGLHHEAQGQDWGLELWDEWSAGGSKYKSIDDLAPHWRSFGKSKGRLVTIQTVFNQAGGVSPEDFDDLDAIPPPPAPKAKFPVLPVHTFAQGQAPEWLIKGLLPRGALAVIYGESGAGKSFAALDIMAALASGSPWNGLRTTRVRVVYICAEGINGFRLRLRAYERHTGVVLSDLSIGVIADAPSLLGLDHKAIAASVHAWGGADVIFLDTFAQMTPGANENSSEDMGKALGACRALHSATGALIVLVHHAGKDASKGARGWSGLKAAADTELEVSRDGDARKIKVSKQKDGEDGRSWAFRLRQVDLGVDQDGDPVTSCVIDYESDKARIREPRGKWQRLVWRVVLEHCDLIDGSADRRAVLQDAVDRMPSDTEEEKKRRKERATSALDDLITGGWVVFEEGVLKPAGGDYS